MVLFNLIFWLLSNVILVIRNGCLPKFGHLQSTVNKLLKKLSTNAWLETVVKKKKMREGGFIGGWINEFLGKHTHTLFCEDPALDMTRHLNLIWWHHAFRWKFTLLYVYASCSKMKTHPLTGGGVGRGNHCRYHSPQSCWEVLPTCTITLFAHIFKYC